MKRILDRRFGWLLAVDAPRLVGPNGELLEVAPRKEEKREEKPITIQSVVNIIQLEDDKEAGGAPKPGPAADADPAEGDVPPATGDILTDGPTVRRSPATTGPSGTSGAGRATGTSTAARGGSHAGRGATGAGRTESAPPPRYTGFLREDGEPADAVVVDEGSQGLRPNFGSDEIVAGRPDLQTILEGAGRRATGRYNRGHTTSPKKEGTTLPLERDFHEKLPAPWKVPMTADSQRISGETATRIPPRPISDLAGTPMQGVYRFEGDSLQDGHFEVIDDQIPADADWVGYARGTASDQNYAQPIRVFSGNFPEYMQNRFYDWVVGDEGQGRTRTSKEALDFVHQVLVGNEELPERFQPRPDVWEVAELNHGLTLGKGNKPADVTKAEALYAEKRRGLTPEQKRAILSTTDAKAAIRLLEGKATDLRTSEEILAERSDHWTEGQQREIEKWEERRDEVQASSLITDPDDPRARQLAILEAVTVDLPAKGRQIEEKQGATEGLRDFYRRNGTDGTNFTLGPGGILVTTGDADGVEIEDEVETEYLRLIKAMEDAGVEPEIFSAITGNTPISDGTSDLTPEGVLNLYLGNTPAANAIAINGVSNLSEQEQQVAADIARLEQESDPAVMEPLVKDIEFLRDYDRFASALNDGRYPEMRTLHQKQFGTPGGFNDRNLTADGREYYREQRKNRRTENGESLTAFENVVGTPGRIGAQVSTLTGLPQTIADALKNFGQTIGLDLTDTQLDRYLGMIGKYATEKDSRRTDLLTKRFKPEDRKAPEYAAGKALEERVKNYAVDGAIKDVEKADAHQKEVAAVATQWSQTDTAATEKENKANRKKPRFVTPHKTWIEV